MSVLLASTHWYGCTIGIAAPIRAQSSCGMLHGHREVVVVVVVVVFATAVELNDFVVS